MAIATLSYSAGHYNSLLGIADASSRLQAEDIIRLTSNIGQAFVKHKAHKSFGITMLHKHFSLENDEMLVNIGPVAAPLRTSALAAKSPDIKGSAWRFVEEGIVPYEFTYDAHPNSDIKEFQPFVSELKAVLDDWDLTDKFGLCVLSDKDLDLTTQIEFTHGRANITLPFDVASKDGPNRSIEAVWQFDSSLELDSTISIEDKPCPIVFKKCKVACKYGPNTGHQGDHKTTNK